MKILFIYPGNISTEQPLGLLYISAVLKKNGHKTTLFHLTPYKLEKSIGLNYRCKRDLIKKIKSFKPNMIGFSVSSTEYPFSLELAKLIKKNFDIPIVFGGPHPTVDPLNTIEEDCIDVVCIGEGEGAIAQLVTNMEEGKSIVNIKNLWVKNNGKIFKNDVSPLIQNLDALPYPDRELIGNKFYIENRYGSISFITGRGCPFQCSYCINTHVRNLYKNRGQYIRFRSVKSIIKEIKETVKRYKNRTVVFSDDTFTLDKQRTIEFCDIYKKEIGLPFLCQTRANVVDGEVLKVLKDAGCELVSFGIESGNDFIRNGVLKRGMTNETIVTAFKLAKDVGLKTGSFNMIGIPFETEKEIWDTININRIVNPDLLHCTVLMPLKGTEIGRLCERNGWIKEKISESYYTTVTQELPTISSQKLFAYQLLFELYVRLPKKYYPLVNFLKTVLAHVPKNNNIRRVVYYTFQKLNKAIIKVAA